MSGTEPDRAEIRDQLGLRTQELPQPDALMADNSFFLPVPPILGQQTRNIYDLGAEIRSFPDVVRIMRQFQPDIILTCFPPDARAGHGHHTVSAVLACGI